MTQLPLKITLLLLVSVTLFASSSRIRIPPPRHVSVSLVNDLKNSSEVPTFEGDRIVGGVDALPQEFPWIVTIEFREGSTAYFCAGYIISSSWVLSAAHCCGGTKSSYVITAGVQQLSDTSGTQSRSAAQVTPNPNYSAQTMYNDICLVKVTSPFDFSGANIKPIGLAVPNQQTDYKTCTVAGWGMENGTANGQPDKLQKVSISVIPNQDCQLYMAISRAKAGSSSVHDADGGQGVVPHLEDDPEAGKAYTLASSQICAGGNGKSSCYGDSGGPFMCPHPTSGHLLGCGVVSGGASCGGEGIYTRVSSYLSWIAQLTGVGSGS